jgi:hypothetical protein
MKNETGISLSTVIWRKFLKKLTVEYKDADLSGTPVGLG